MITNKSKETEKKEDPCWKNFHQIGIKTKEGKKVPNCIPEEKKKK